MVNVILKTLQKKPEDRFRDAMEMAEELKRIRTMLDENVFADESAREERRTGSDKGAARRRKKRVSVTGYSIVMPDGAIGPDSPYSRAKRRRPSSPSASRKRGRGLSEEEEGKLVSASSEILEILKDVKTPPPLPAAAAEDVSECDETKDPRATPLAIPAADLPDDTQDEEKEEKPGGGPGIDTDEIDKNW